MLELCAAHAERAEAGLALARWAAWQRACGRDCGNRERRFRRRSYERARDRALTALLMRASQRPGADAARPRGSAAGQRGGLDFRKRPASVGPGVLRLPLPGHPRLR